MRGIPSSPQKRSIIHEKRIVISMVWKGSELDQQLLKGNVDRFTNLLEKGKNLELKGRIFSDTRS